MSPKTEIKKSHAKIITLALIILAIGYFGFYQPAQNPQPGQIAEASYEDKIAEKEEEIKKATEVKQNAELEAQAIEAEKKALELRAKKTDTEVVKQQSPKDNGAVATLVSTINSIAPAKIMDDKTELPIDDSSLWASKIDAYIAKMNPNINNQGCGTITGQDWVKAGKKYGNHPYFLVAIARADTSLGKGLTNRCNLGNTGHCDSCREGNKYGSFINSVNSISQTVSNQYLGKGNLSCHYSRGGWKKCPDGQTINNGKFYASSMINWDNNVTDTLANLFGSKQQFYKIKL